MKFFIRCIYVIIFTSLSIFFYLNIVDANASKPRAIPNMTYTQIVKNYCTSIIQK